MRFQAKERQSCYPRRGSSNRRSGEWVDNRASGRQIQMFEENCDIVRRESCWISEPSVKGLAAAGTVAASATAGWLGRQWRLIAVHRGVRVQAAARRGFVVHLAILPRGLGPPPRC